MTQEQEETDRHKQITLDQRRLREEFGLIRAGTLWRWSVREVEEIRRLITNYYSASDQHKLEL